jgi:hypothetical protein
MLKLELSASSESGERNNYETLVEMGKKKAKRVFL